MKISADVYAKQEQLEIRYDKKRIFELAKADLVNTAGIPELLAKGAVLLREWLHGEYFEGKAQRLSSMALLDLDELVTDIITEVSLACAKPVLMVQIASQIAHISRLADTAQAIQTMAEAIAVLAETDLYDVYRQNPRDPRSSFVVQARFVFDDVVTDHMYEATYLPPMTHRPKKLHNNRSSGYLTQKGSSLILGGIANHHEWDICLDVLNIQNAVEFELDAEYLQSSVEPVPSKVADNDDEEITYISREQRTAIEQARKNFDQYKRQCDVLYDLYLENGSLFFTNKVDKRGRVYACGYHLSPQGNSHKKAMLNLKSKALPTGIDSFLENCK